MKFKILNRECWILVVILFVFNLGVNAQSEVSGIVVEEASNLPLPGACILEQNTTNGTIADLSGKFTINVKDSANIQISFVGFKDTIVKASEYTRDTIRLVNNQNLIVHYFYANTFHVGYFGDLNRFPYGLSIYHTRPYLFHNTVHLSGQLNYKTDLGSNYDLKFVLKKAKAINLNNYQMSIAASFQQRNYNDLDIRDYDVIINNYIMHRFSISLGYALKNDLRENYKGNHGFQIGASKYFHRTLTYVCTDFTSYKTFSEYGVILLQRLSTYKKFWNSLKFGLEYQSFEDYEELNLVARYNFSI